MSRSGHSALGLATALLLASLVACGGGDEPEPEPDKTTEPVICATPNPERCK